MRRLERGDIIAGLLLLVFILAVANLGRYGFATEAFFSAHEKTIDGGTKIIGGVLVLAGALASYFRFFKGRTFAARAELLIKVDVMPGATGTNLHAIAIELRNVGTLPIWEPHIRLRAQTLQEPAVETVDITGWQTERLGATDQRVAVVDPQETALFVAETYIPTHAWAVRYEASVEDRNGDLWNSMKTVSNLPHSGDE